MCGFTCGLSFLGLAFGLELPGFVFGIREVEDVPLVAAYALPALVFQGIGFGYRDAPHLFVGDAFEV